MGWLHRRTGKALALALTAVWVVTLAFADTAVTPVMRCLRGHMPCCPSTSTCESCTSAQCTEQVPEKAEAQATRVQKSDAVAVLPAQAEDPIAATPGPMQELTTGLCYHASVFRLKDDLRI
jgi:hypothetical protein